MPLSKLQRYIKSNSTFAHPYNKGRIYRECLGIEPYEEFDVVTLR